MFGAIAAASTGVRRADAWMTAAAGDIAAAGLPLTSAAVAPAATAAPLPTPAPDLTVDMPNLLVATDAYRLNLAVLSRAQDAYASIIDMVRRD